MMHWMRTHWIQATAAIFFGIPVVLGLALAVYLFVFVALLGGAPCPQHSCP